ncbi:cupredoxin domain-containing protein [Salinilacihabitans rarus]|uniref:cupredoxin domain-containing protein n=1 Tax=Salinilacihabitans rarus TaxID=2961596 RepID=UPI0020C8F138|nr:plastocyanin/azurin family copper-binding protein [Salinilacihabitans rarus]
MNRRVYLAALGSAATAGLAGCSALGDIGGGNGPCDGHDCDVGMNRNSFLPDRYEVRVGETVVWKNTSEADHTITAYEDAIPDGAAYFATGGFEDEQSAREAWHGERGGRLGTRETFEHTFEIPGTYNYACIPHEIGGMTGQIVVSE